MVVGIARELGINFSRHGTIITTHYAVIIMTEFHDIEIRKYFPTGVFPLYLTNFWDIVKFRGYWVAKIDRGGVASCVFDFSFVLT